MARFRYLSCVRSSKGKIEEPSEEEHDNGTAGVEAANQAESQDCVTISGHATMYTKLTYGYVAPEYVMTDRVNFKYDIYSFGVVLLELISGRKANDTTRIRYEGIIVLWARPLLRASKKFTEIADPLMKGKYPYRGLVQALGLVRRCLQENGDKRPLIAEVVTTLSNLVSQSQIYEEAWVTSEDNPFTTTMVHRAQAVDA